MYEQKKEEDPNVLVFTKHIFTERYYLDEIPTELGHEEEKQKEKPSASEKLCITSNVLEY